MPSCKTCKHWVRYSVKYPRSKEADDKMAGGICESEKFWEGDWYGHPPDALVYPYDEGGEFWTGPEFGCVHFVEATA